MIYVALAFFFFLSVALAALLYRASVRLLQFDRILESIAPVMEEYGDELRKTLSAGLLEDHPEVMAFHRLNLRTMGKIDEVVDLVRAVKPRAPQEPVKPRPPVVE